MSMRGNHNRDTPMLLVTQNKNNSTWLIKNIYIYIYILKVGNRKILKEKHLRNLGKVEKRTKPE